MIGTIEKIELTSNGFGNQVLTIDGRNLCTWLEWHELSLLKVGCKVEYEIERISLGNFLAISAIIIKVIETPANP